MAEQSSIREGMERWLEYVRDYHIDEWQYDHEQRLADVRGEWHGAIQDIESIASLPAHFAALEHLTHTMAERNNEHDDFAVAIPPEAHLNYYAYDAAQQEERRLEAELDRERVVAQDRLSDLDYEYPDEDPEGEEPLEERPYETQYTGMLGSSPGRIEIDTSDADMGGRWQDQLAALDARMDALAQEVDMQQHIDMTEGMSY